MCPNKLQIKNAVPYFLFNYQFTVDPMIFCEIISIPMGSQPASFFANLFLYFYESKYEINMNHLIKGRTLSNIPRFMDDLNAINDSAEFQSNYCHIYL